MNTLPRLTQTDLHLTDEQLVDLLAGSQSANPHLDACAQCQSELADLHLSLAGLRTAATNMAAERTPQLTLRQAHHPARSHFRRPIWAASLATAAALLTISVSVFHPRPVVVIAPAAPPEISVSDEALLEGIQSDLSTSIPPSLEPLAVPTATRSSH